VKEVRVKEELKRVQLRSIEDASERFDDDGGGCQQPTDHPDARRSRLRGIIARIERQMPVAIPLQATWHELIDALALGPEPALRSCPHCGKLVMLEATRCGHCWTQLALA
jgi:hypothetical protein